jgi:hypothetical protein
MMVWEAELENGLIVSEKDKNFSKVKDPIKRLKSYDLFNNTRFFEFDEYGKFNLCGNELFTLVVADKEYKLLKKYFKKVIQYKQGMMDLGGVGVMHHLPVYHIGYENEYKFDDLVFNCTYDLSYDENTHVVKLDWFLESNKTMNAKLVIQYGNKFSELPIFMIAGQRLQTARTIGIM